VQYAPEILPFIKIHVDTNRRNGSFFLTGSQVFNLMAGVTESLAGRAGLFELLPFSFNELGEKPGGISKCFEQILRGFYPVPNTEKTDIRAFYGAYLSLYIERDVRQIQNIKDLSTFEVFLQLLAGKICLISPILPRTAVLPRRHVKYGFQFWKIPGLYIYFVHGLKMLVSVL
jgi:predicted AAA+ superfamily ATPase